MSQIGSSDRGEGESEKKLGMSDQGNRRRQERRRGEKTELIMITSETRSHCIEGQSVIQSQ